MLPTSLSLLDRLKAAKPDAPDWHQLQAIYLPLIQNWITRVLSIKDDSADISQEVFLVVIRELPTFNRQRDGAFRAWLRTITFNRLRTYWKQKKRQPMTGLGYGDETDDLLARLEDPASDLSLEWDRQHDRHVFQKLLASARPDFGSTTWEAFQRFAIHGKPAAVVADELGISVNAVLQAKSRILKRLREEAAGLID